MGTPLIFSVQFLSSICLSLAMKGEQKDHRTSGFKRGPDACKYLFAPRRVHIYKRTRVPWRRARAPWRKHNTSGPSYSRKQMRAREGTHPPSDENSRKAAQHGTAYSLSVECSSALHSRGTSSIARAFQHTCPGKTARLPPR